MPLTVVLTGVMAVGETTGGDLLVHNFPRSAHLRGDMFRKMIVVG